MTDEKVPENETVNQEKQSSNANSGEHVKTFSEELELAGNQLVSKLQEIIREGNVRRIVIKTADDRVLMDTTLTIGALTGGVFALAMWPIAAIAAIAAVVSRVKVEIIREVTDGDDDSELNDSKTRIQIDTDDE